MHTIKASRAPIEDSRGLLSILSRIFLIYIGIAIYFDELSLDYFLTTVPLLVAFGIIFSIFSLLLACKKVIFYESHMEFIPSFEVQKKVVSFKEVVSFEKDQSMLNLHRFPISAENAAFFQMKDGHTVKILQDFFRQRVEHYFLKNRRRKE